MDIESDEKAARPTVLLVEDENALRRAGQLLLGSAGFDVVCCADGVEAVEVLRGHSFDVIVSDISMPNMGGIALLRAVRQHDPDLPVILVTGAPAMDTAVDAVEHGAFKYLMKPVSADQLIDSTRRAVQLYQLAKAKQESLRVLGSWQGGSSDRIGLSAALDRAIETLWPAFQPIVSAADGSLFGFEALLRSNEPMLPHPGAVLDAAERLGQLDRVGRVMRDRASQHLFDSGRRWQLFINLHPEDLSDPSLLDRNSTLWTCASNIVLEVTERVSLDRVPDVRGRVRALRDAGFRIAVDDLGAGYAGLASFVSLEPEFVKLDMSLVRDVDTSVTKQKLVRTMTTLCRDMGLFIIAEGVETKSERDVLVELGCNLLQGYWFGKPERTPVDPTW